MYSSNTWLQYNHTTFMNESLLLRECFLRSLLPPYDSGLCVKVLGGEEVIEAIRDIRSRNSLVVIDAHSTMQSARMPEIAAALGVHLQSRNARNRHINGGRSNEV
jgi:hypothetical protein